MIDVLAVVAATWGVAMALSPLLQIRAIRAHGTSKGVSVGYQRVLLVGFVLWLSYGIALRNPAIIVPNSVAAVVCVATILIVLRYRYPRTPTIPPCRTGH